MENNMDTTRVFRRIILGLYRVRGLGFIAAFTCSGRPLFCSYVLIYKILHLKTRKGI